MIRLLANENVPLPSVRMLRQAGHDVVSVSEHSPGMTDDAVLALAHADKRVLVTFDRDYGELVFRRGMPHPLAIVFLRFRPADPLEPGRVLSQFLARAGADVPGRFITLDRDSFRTRAMP